MTTSEFSGAYMPAFSPEANFQVLHEQETLCGLARSVIHRICWELTRRDTPVGIPDIADKTLGAFLAKEFEVSLPAPGGQREQSILTAAQLFAYVIACEQRVVAAELFAGLDRADELVPDLTMDMIIAGAEALTDDLADLFDVKISAILSPAGLIDGFFKCDWGSLNLKRDAVRHERGRTIPGLPGTVVFRKELDALGTGCVLDPDEAPASEGLLQALLYDEKDLLIGIAEIAVYRTLPNLASITDYVFALDALHQRGLEVADAVAGALCDAGAEVLHDLSLTAVVNNWQMREDMRGQGLGWVLLREALLEARTLGGIAGAYYLPLVPLQHGWPLLCESFSKEEVVARETSRQQLERYMTECFLEEDCLHLDAWGEMAACVIREPHDIAGDYQESRCLQFWEERESL